MSAPDRPSGPPLEPAKLAELVSGFASDVKAHDIVELDLRGVLGYTDYFVVATGGTDRQVKAIHDRIHEGMKKEHGLLPRRVEGVSEARWILMDYWTSSSTSSPPRRASSTASSSSGARRPSARRRRARRRVAPGRAAPVGAALTTRARRGLCPAAGGPEFEHWSLPSPCNGL